MSEENLLPEEMSEQGQAAIVQDLYHLYDTTLEDQQSLARIRARFLQKSAPELPIAAISAEEPLSIIEQITSHRTVKSSLSQKWQAQQPWIRRLNLLAALFLAAILVGSLVLILAQSRQTTVGSTSFQSQSGWHTMFSYSGTGSKTISGLSIILPQLYKVRVNCVGGDKVDMLLESTEYKNATGLDPCTNELHRQPSQASYSYDLVSRPIHTIIVTAQSQTTWYLQIDRADTQPNFTLQPFWHELAGDGADTRAAISFGSDGHSDPNASAKTWGIVIMCQGHGSGTIHLMPDIRDIQVTSCSMQPTLLVVHYPYKATVTEVTTTISKSEWFDMHILSCQDEAQCRSLPSAPIVKPGN